MCLLLDLDIQLVKCLDVITRERDRHQQDVLLANVCKPFHGIRRLRSLPCRRADLRLPGQTVWVRESEILHDGHNRGGDFGDVGVSAATG
jgi:hypothetical protein